MKRWFVSTALMMLVVLSSPSLALAATLSLFPSSGTFNKGCSFFLDVVLDTQGVQTDGTDAILMYDPSRFSINTSAITPKTNIYPDFPGNNVDEVGGKITISGLASVNTPFSGKGTLATLQFTVKDTAPTGLTQVNFDFDPNNKAKTTDSNVVERTTIVDTLNSVVNGSYVVGTGQCAQTSLNGTSNNTTGTGLSKGGPIDTSSSSGTFYRGGTSTGDIPINTLPEGGTPQLTSALVIFGSILTVLGVLGLALL